MKQLIALLICDTYEAQQGSVWKDISKSAIRCTHMFVVTNFCLIGHKAHSARKTSCLVLKTQPTSWSHSWILDENPHFQASIISNCIFSSYPLSTYKCKYHIHQRIFSLQQMETIREPQLDTVYRSINGSSGAQPQRLPTSQLPHLQLSKKSLMKGQKDLRV